jgi:large subunit ribosomal protein L1
VQFRVDKPELSWNHRPSFFDTDKLQGNLAALIEALVKAKPATSKGVYLRKVAALQRCGRSRRHAIHRRSPARDLSTEWHTCA